MAAVSAAGGVARSLGEAGAFVRPCGASRADVALDLMGNHKAGVIAGALARRTADRLRPHGTGASRRALSGSTGRSRRAGRTPSTACSRCSTPSDLPPEPADFGPAKLFREEPAAARELLAAHPEPFALLHPGAGWANKRYPPAWWGETARLLQAETGVPTWVASARGEEALAAEVEAAGGGAVRASCRPPTCPRSRR